MQSMKKRTIIFSSRIRSILQAFARAIYFPHVLAWFYKSGANRYWPPVESFIFSEKFRRKCRNLSLHAIIAPSWKKGRQESRVQSVPLSKSRLNLPQGDVWVLKKQTPFLCSGCLRPTHSLSKMYIYPLYIRWSFFQPNVLRFCSIMKGLGAIH